MAHKKGMEKPVKPRLPRKPASPRKRTRKYKDIGRTSAWGRRISLENVIRKMIDRTARKTGRNPEDVTVDEIFLTGFSASFEVWDGEENPKYEEQLAVYNEEKLPKFKKAMKRYEERMKQYEINLKVWEAWKLKQKEDRIRNRLAKAKKELEEVTRQKAVLVEETGNHEETEKT